MSEPSPKNLEVAAEILKQIRLVEQMWQRSSEAQRCASQWSLEKAKTRAIAVTLDRLLLQEIECPSQPTPAKPRASSRSSPKR